MLPCSEKAIQSLISDWLSTNRIVHWRVNSGAISLSNSPLSLKRKNRFIRFLFFLYPKDTALAFPDLAGIYHGTYFTIECKKPGAKPTQNQINAINLINSQGGLAFWTDSLDIVIEKFQNFFQQPFIS